MDRKKQAQRVIDASYLTTHYIKGTRKWSTEPQYLHSLRVFKLLKKYKFPHEVCVAWFLHDMIEDSDFTREDLKKYWYSDRILDLVCLCSHDKSNPDKFGRWEDMINNLKSQWDIDAWAIKLADITDNLTECHLLSPDALKRFLTKKAPVFVYYGNKYFWWSTFYSNFIENYYNQYVRWIAKTRQN